MLPPSDRILPARLPALCRLLLDDVGIPIIVRTRVLESLFYWWASSTEQAAIEELEAAIQMLADSSVASEVAEGLLRCVDSEDHRLASRAVGLLGYFSSETEASVPILVRTLSTRTGADRWGAATALARLGIQDAWIMRQIGRATGEGVSPEAQIPKAARAFDLEHFRSLYRCSLIGTATPAEKGKALEDLAEYMFLSVPGLNTIARNLRTLAEEIDLAVSNDGDGFWRQLGDPFVVECKNLAAAVDARTIRDFRVKLQTKGLRGGFVVTTSQLTKDATVEIRQALAEGRAIVAVENEHLAAIAEGRPLLEVLSERFYRCRLL